MENILAPSILSADFKILGEQIEQTEKAGAKYIHFDVMDGIFVPSISFGMPVLSALKGAVKQALDVHLMVTEPIRYVKEFAKCGADIITVHLEACEDVKATVDEIKASGVKAGITIKPATPVKELIPYLELADMFLIMSVEPGFGGQSFIEGSTEKVAELRRKIDRCGSRAVIEIDGGITLANAAEVYAAGCEVLVAGSTVFASENPEATIHELLNV